MDNYVEKSPSIGCQLKALRKRQGLTQQEVAKRANTTSSAICRYESSNYERYELSTIKKVVESCGGNLEICITGPEK